jgi:hypothetical protein
VGLAPEKKNQNENGEWAPGLTLDGYGVSGHAYLERDVFLQDLGRRDGEVSLSISLEPRYFYT